MTAAAAETLSKVWRAGLSLEDQAADHPRIAAIARLEQAVCAELPRGMLRPCDLVARALPRIAHAKTVLGPVEFVGLSDLVHRVGVPWCSL